MHITFKDLKKQTVQVDLEPSDTVREPFFWRIHTHNGRIRVHSNLNTNIPGVVS